MRPASIVRFRSLWGAVIPLSALNMALAAPTTVALYRQARLFEPLGLTALGGLLLLDFANIGLLALLLWLVVGRGSRLAAFLVVGLGGYNLIALVSLIAGGQRVPGFTGMLAVICVVLEIAAATMLLRRDARKWLKRGRMV